MKTKIYNILDKHRLKININLDDNEYNFLDEDLFKIAGRINKKRSFLFVSTLLGKHIPVNPKLSIATGRLLGLKMAREILDFRSPLKSIIAQNIKDKKIKDEEYYKIDQTKIELEDNTLFLGFAETATALAHSVFDGFKGNISYIHTTRDKLIDLESFLQFDEEHSHAVGHFLYLENEDAFKNAKRIVLIDDEMTTGRTGLNFIKELNKRYENKEYIILSLLDWRSKRDKDLYKQFEKENNIKIKTITLLSGEIKLEVLDDKKALKAEYAKDNFDKNKGVNYICLNEELDFKKHIYKKSIDEEYELSYLVDSGRFLIDFKKEEKLNEKLKTLAQKLKEFRTFEDSLCMGSEEFMYIPMKIASYMGDNIAFQSTTQSPIFPMNKENYGAKNAFKFKNFKNLSNTNYFYNMDTNKYKEVFFFVEGVQKSSHLDDVIKELKRAGFEKINMVLFTSLNN
ncbi:MAG: phosphoribosyltransferase family protein [Peptostreptococcaceae bacterium]|jgi:hypothetical protein|nr:phosphoribosyltransferase family protein [Peptostreptococcaceae bacterium]